MTGLTSILVLVVSVAPAAEAAQPQVVGSPDAPLVAEVLGLSVHTTRADEMRQVILVTLTDRYAADRGISVSAAEVDAYLAEQRRFMAAQGVPLPGPGSEPAEDRAAREQIARAYILQHKIDAALYRQYGGRIARQDGAPVPVDAYRQFLEAQAVQGRFRIVDPVLEAGFWRSYAADSPYEVYPPGGEAEARAFELPGTTPGEASKATAAPLVAFNKTLTLRGVRFRVVCANASSVNRLEIIPAGLEIDNTSVSRTIEGTVTGAEVADLDGDGSPEIYVYVASAGSGSYGSLVAYGANRRKSLSEIYLPPITEHAAAAKGYQGHDRFAVVDKHLVRRFPLYKPTDPNASPTGGTRQVQYKLTRGEAGWWLEVDRVVDD